MYHYILATLEATEHEGVHRVHEVPDLFGILQVGLVTRKRFCPLRHEIGELRIILEVKFSTAALRANNIEDLVFLEKLFRVRCILATDKKLGLCCRVYQNWIGHVALGRERRLSLVFLVYGVRQIQLFKEFSGLIIVVEQGLLLPLRIVVLHVLPVNIRLLIRQKAEPASVLIDNWCTAIEICKALIFLDFCTHVKRVGSSIHGEEIQNLVACLI